MRFGYDIPDSFWSLFRSVNRDHYIEALLKISEEYEYNNYFLSREVCIQVLSDWNADKRIWLQREEFESELDVLETPPNRILNWLIKTGWLKKLDDFSTLTSNIVIPDYAAVFLDAFEQLVNPQMEDTEIYIQNVYATLFSFQNDKRINLGMLKTALINTKKLNKALQDLLHNMDKFFGRLLKQQSYGDVLAEHLEGYVAPDRQHGQRTFQICARHSHKTQLHAQRRGRYERNGGQSFKALGNRRKEGRTAFSGGGKNEPVTSRSPV